MRKKQWKATQGRKRWGCRGRGRRPRACYAALAITGGKSRKSRCYAGRRVRLGSGLRFWRVRLGSGRILGSPIGVRPSILLGSRLSRGHTIGRGQAFGFFDFRRSAGFDWVRGVRLGSGLRFLISNVATVTPRLNTGLTFGFDLYRLARRAIILALIRVLLGSSITFGV
jgi:hypothetical protein